MGYVNSVGYSQTEEGDFTIRVFVFTRNLEWLIQGARQGTS